MEPLSLAVIRVTSNHLTITDTVAVTVSWLITVNVAFVLFLHAAGGIIIGRLLCNEMGSASFALRFLRIIACS